LDPINNPISPEAGGLRYLFVEKVLACTATIFGGALNRNPNPVYLPDKFNANPEKVISGIGRYFTSVILFFACDSPFTKRRLM